MTFEIVEKSYGCIGIKDNEVSVGKSGVSFGKNTSKLFIGFTNCEVYLDQANKKVGLKPSNDKIKGFRVGEDNTNNTRKSISGGWVKRLPHSRFIPTFEDDMIILNNCDIADNESRTANE